MGSATSDLSCYTIIIYKTWDKSQRWWGESLTTPSWLICCFPMLLLLLLVASVVSDSVQLHRGQPTRLPRPWDSPGKSAGAGCHFLLQSMKVKRENEVAQLRPTHSDLMDCGPPGSSIHGIFQYWSGLPLPSPFFSIVI